MALQKICYKPKVGQVHLVGFAVEAELGDPREVVQGVAVGLRVACLAHLPSRLDKSVLVKMLDCKQGAHYLAITREGLYK